MSSPTQLSILAQLILSNDSKVVETAASLLYSLVSANDMACCNLYSTGVFYFGCRHTGSHFQSISRLFSSTHLRQSFHTNSSSLFKELSLGEQSILGNILPEALLNALVIIPLKFFVRYLRGTWTHRSLFGAPCIAHSSFKVLISTSECSCLLSVSFPWRAMSMSLFLRSTTLVLKRSCTFTNIIYEIYAMRKNFRTGQYPIHCSFFMRQ